MNRSTRKARGIAAACIAALALSACGGSGDAAYPQAPIDLIIPWGAGGSSDLAARLFASHLEDDLGVQVNPINQAGANGANGWANLAAAEPDGETFGLITYDILTNQVMNADGTKLEDIDFLMQFEEQPFGLYVNSEGRFQDIEGIVAAGPDATFGTTGLGGNGHQAPGLLAQATGVTFTYVPFDGSNEQITALLGNHVDAIVAAPTATAQYVESGDFVQLATFTAERTEIAPDVPTLQELGYDVPPYSSFRGFGAPKGLPDDVRQTLTDALEATFDDPEFAADAEEMNMDLVYLDSTEFTEYLNDTLPVVSEVLNDLDLL